MRDSDESLEIFWGGYSKQTLVLYYNTFKTTAKATCKKN